MLDYHGSSVLEKFRNYLFVSTVFFVLTISLITVNSYAQTEDSSESSVTYKVGTYLLNVGKIDLQTVLMN